MQAASIAFDAARWVARLPPVMAWRAARYEHRFANAGGHARLYRGLYRSFAEAVASIPPTRPLGYDNPQSASRLEADRHRLFPSDYPVLFWLAKLLPDFPSVFDFGGNVGISYYGYRKLLAYPPSLDWLVCDVEATVARGREIAAEEPAPGLRFTTELAQLGSADILLALGVLHYLEDPINFLRTTARLPRHVILNKIPLHESKSAVTIEAMGTAFSPYHLLNRHDVTAALAERGYECVDAWNLPGMSCNIPFHPEWHISIYSGFYFRRMGTATD